MLARTYQSFLHLAPHVLTALPLRSAPPPLLLQPILLPAEVHHELGGLLAGLHRLGQLLAQLGRFTAANGGDLVPRETQSCVSPPNFGKDLAVLIFCFKLFLNYIFCFMGMQNLKPIACRSLFAILCTENDILHL